MSGQNSIFSITNTNKTKLSLVGQLFWTLGTLIRPFQGVVIADPNGIRKKKEASNSPKRVMREHEGAEFLLY